MGDNINPTSARSLSGRGHGESSARFEELSQLAGEIESTAKMADEYLVAASKALRDARRLIENGKAGDANWYAWVDRSVKLPQAQKRILVRVAEADDPAKVIERQRRRLAARI